MSRSKFTRILPILLLSSLSISASEISFNSSSWDNNPTEPGYLESSATGQITLDGVTTSITFGDTGVGKLGSWSHAYVNSTNYEGFAIGSSSSENIDQNGSGLTNAVTISFTFSSPVAISDLTFEDLDSSWGNSGGKNEWIDAIYIEGWSDSSTYGGIGTGDVSAVYSNIGSDLSTNTQAQVTGISSGFSTNIASANDADHMFTASIGDTDNPIQSMRVYYVSRGNTNSGGTGHSVALSDTFTVTPVPEPSSTILLSAALGFIITRRKK